MTPPSKNEELLHKIKEEMNIIYKVKQRKKTAVAQWLRYCATNRKLADSIPTGVIGTFH